MPNPKIPFKTTKFRPVGVMDKDSNYRYVNTKKGDYIDAQNIQHVGLGVNGDEFIYPMSGNTLAFTCPTVTVQNKTYQLTIQEPATGVNNYSVQFKNSNGSKVYNGTVLYPVATLATTGVLATDVNSLVASINAWSGSFSYTVVATGNTSTGVITVVASVPSFPGIDWILYDLGAVTPGDVSCNVTITQEAIPSNLAGQCFPIGGVDYLGDLFMMSSSQTKAQKTFPITAVVNSSGAVEITVTGNLTGIVANFGEILVNGVQGLTNSINGLWLADVQSYGSSTVIVLWGSAFQGTWTSGTGTIVVNSEGYLDISVHQTDALRVSWNGISLLRTRSLGNRLPNLLRYCGADSANGVIGLYFTDNNDPPRCVEYSGPYVTDGAIEIINPAYGQYAYDNINIETNLLLKNSTAAIDLVNVANGGGNVLSGLWRYSVMFADANLTTTQPSELSGPVQIFSADESQPANVIGNVAGTVTTKSVTLQISNIPVNVFPYLYLIGVNYVGGTEEAYLIKRVSIPEGQDSINVTHTGFETYQNFDAGSLAAVGNTITKVGTMEITSDTLLLADLTLQQINDCTAWGKTFQHTIKKGTGLLKPVGDDLAGWTFGEYQDPQATFRYVGYTDNETVRFGYVIEFADGTFSPAFWIDDIRFDNLNVTLGLNTIVGTFQVGDNITGSSSGATAQIAYISGTTIWLINIIGTFTTSDHITGSISGATAHVGSVGSTPINRANPFGVNNRLGSFSSYDLSPGYYTVGGSYRPQFNNAYVTYVTFSNIDFTFLVNGIPMSQFIGQGGRIHIVRIDNGPNQLNEVLGCGLLVRHAYGQWVDHLSNEISSASNDTTTFFDNPFLFTDMAQDLYSAFSSTTPSLQLSNVYPSPGGYNPYSFGAWTGGTFNISLPVWSNSCSFYCPDVIYGQTSIQGVAGDFMIDYGQPDFRGAPGGTVGAYADTSWAVLDFDSATTYYFAGVFIKLTGATYLSSEPAYNPVTNFTTAPSFSGVVGWLVGHNYNTSTQAIVASPPLPPTIAATYSWDTIGHYLIATTNAILQNNPQMGNTAGGYTAGAYDLGVYYMQYYRDKGSLSAAANAAIYPNNTKFGAITSGVYIPTGNVVPVPAVNTIESVDVFGGDTFTQKTWFKLRYPTNQQMLGNESTGAGVGVAFFCQNRMNFNMRYNSNAPYTQTFPQNCSVADWMLFSYMYIESRQYDAGYTPRNEENQIPAYDPALPYVTEQPARISFSQAKPQDSVINNFRIFPPLNIYDMPTNLGAVTKLVELQEELFILQQRKFWRAFYNETGTLDTSGAGGESEIVLGSAAKMSKPPDGLSDIGTSNLFSVIKGTGVTGEDVVAWIDVTTRNVMMFSVKGGLRTISEEKNMRSFFLNALTFVTADTPAAQNGITGVFDEKRKEFIWTVMGCLPATLSNSWGYVSTYNKGDVVWYGYTLEGLPQYYISLQNGNAYPTNVPGAAPLWWAPIPYTNTQYYSMFSVAYSLLKDGFTSFYSPRPYIYFAWENTYLSAYPNFTYNGMYLHDTGTILTWYPYNSTSQAVVGTLTYVVNEEDGFAKRWMAMQVDSLIVPTRFDFTTPTTASFMVAADFDQIANFFVGAIKNDTISSITGSNEDDTTFLYGPWITAMFTFDIGVQQNLANIYTKYGLLTRVPIM